VAIPPLDAKGVQGYARGGPAGAAVALTFDDGPNPVWTPVILDLLRQCHARVTFCLIGS
jgi:peptidoglycan/xylan/chitin deacetylase (PgdA/CDA1 family)